MKMTMDKFAIAFLTGLTVGISLTGLLSLFMMEMYD